MTPHARRGIAAVVEPIPPVLLKRLDGPSTSRLGTGQTGYASAELYAALRKGRADGEDVGVAFKWPSERRLPGKGKERETLVIWVAPLDHDVSCCSGIGADPSWPYKVAYSTSPSTFFHASRRRH